MSAHLAGWLGDLSRALVGSDFRFSVEQCIILTRHSLSSTLVGQLDHTIEEILSNSATLAVMITQLLLEFI